MEELSLFKVFVAPDAAEDVRHAHGSYITQGPKVEELEQKLGEFNRIQTRWRLIRPQRLPRAALKTPGAWPGLKPGDEVLTALTCTATNWPIMANVLKP